MAITVGAPVQFRDEFGKIHPGFVGAVDSNGQVLSIMYWGDDGRDGASFRDGLARDDTLTSANSWTIAQSA